MTEKTENFSVSSLIFAEPSRMKEGKTGGSEAAAFAFPCVNGNGGANENNSRKSVCKSVFVSGIENVKQKENEHGNSSLLAGCFNGCYRRHSARAVSIFRNIHRCGFFRKNI